MPHGLMTASDLSGKHRARDHVSVELVSERGAPAAMQRQRKAKQCVRPESSCKAARECTCRVSACTAVRARVADSVMR